MGRCLGRCRGSASSEVNGGTDQRAWSSGGDGSRVWISGESGVWASEVGFTGWEKTGLRLDSEIPDSPHGYSNFVQTFGKEANFRERVSPAALLSNKLDGISVEGAKPTQRSSDSILRRWNLRR
ncbi:hypothetical protein FH972_004366 [Carpinus fangiana]|uniref:Uncharacterized protein n=1 Tax=Carpinus fangiana TaxID=176857 RepID=A0A5N6QNN2_9ROSI|nr:hypothetical protein FH972_004366 [Carpinus fangiana]